MSDKDREDYLKVSEWKEVLMPEGRKVYKLKRKKLVKEDSSFSPDEDFSNNVESYFSHKKEIKTVNPEVYRWLENYFSEGVFK